MIKQKALSLKLDIEILEDLDKELGVTWISRNRLINYAVKMYLDAQDARRRAKMAGVGSPDCDRIIGEFLKSYVLPEANYYIGRIDK